MVFSSAVFLFLFLPVVLAGYVLLPSLRLRNTLLLIASLIFYAWGEPGYVFLMMGSIAANYLFGLRVHAGTPRQAKIWVVASIGFNIGVLLIFKYTGFAMENINALIARLGMTPLPIPRIALPLGISFFTFQAMSYVIDVYRGDTSPQRSPFKLGLYISLFPQLIAGPIVRYKDIADEIEERRVCLNEFAIGIGIFTAGLAKKMLLANPCGRVADLVFGLAPEQLAPGVAWLGAAAYTLQIYFDFSGYSDMAVGLGRLFGFHFVRNFNYPYISRSVREFWQRWHISLSTWFRDYLYIPLGGNRRGAWITYRNLLIIFVVCGFWHGASWSFVVWGLLHGAFLVLERTRFGLWMDRMPRLLQHIYTLLMVIFGWVFFRANTLTEAMHYLAAMLGRTGTQPYFTDRFVDPLLILTMAIGLVASIPVWPALSAWLYARMTRTVPARQVMMRWAGGVVGALLVAATLLVCAMLLARGTYNPFIYFRF